MVISLELSVITSISLHCSQQTIFLASSEALFSPKDTVQKSQVTTDALNQYNNNIISTTQGKLYTAHNPCIKQTSNLVVLLSYFLFIFVFRLFFFLSLSLSCCLVVFLSFCIFVFFYFFFCIFVFLSFCLFVIYFPHFHPFPYDNICYNAPRAENATNKKQTQQLNMTEWLEFTQTI